MFTAGTKSNGHISQQNPLCWVLTIIGSFLFLSSFAQHNPVILSDSNNVRPLRLDNRQWKFHPGDSLAWASPVYEDNHWDVIAGTNFGEGKFKRADIPKGWTGFGWFRIWVKKSDPASTNTWGLYLNHDAASETYFDGKKIMTLGQLGHSKETMQSVRNPYLTIPLAITDTLPHLLAIRYSHYGNFFPNFVGFNSSIQDLHQMNAAQKESQRFMDYLLLSASAACILILLHLLLFIFYPKKKINLYYVLFVSVVVIGLYARYQTVAATDPQLQAFYTKLFIGFVLLHLSFGALLLYAAAYEKIPRGRMIIIVFLTLALAIWVWIDWYDVYYSPFKTSLTNWYQMLFALVVYTDAMIAIIKAIRKGNKKLWLIASGLILFYVMGVFVGSNQFGWFTFEEVMIAFAWGNLLMPVLFSIYIALDVASTNRSLEKQLEENKKLTDANLAQEQEKNRLITEHATQLEKTVLERTAQVRQQAEQLKEMDAVKSRFFVNLTHEFRTPLTLITNPAKELLRQANTDAARQYAGFILQNSERLLQLVNQLLDLSRLESGQMEIKNEPLDVIRWMRLHIQQFSSLAEHKGVQLSFHTDTRELLISADPDKLEKILQNLLSNAFKFVTDKGIITVSFIKKPGNQLEINVQDNGIGIAPEKLPYVFDRFYQADATDTRSREGAGIGLALCKELTELLGGSISVRSALHTGTTFTVVLPYKEIEEGTNYDRTALNTQNNHAPEYVHEKEAMPATEPDATTILVVEDNEQLRQFISLSLPENYTVLIAKDGEDGIKTALGSIPTLVITDLMMPRKNGYELCAALKTDERTSHIPVIMLTAKTDRDSRIQGIETGADAYLSKPFDKEELLALIENLIRSRQQLRKKYSKGNNWITVTEELPSIEKKFLERVRTAIEDDLDNDQLSTDFLGRKIGLSRTQLHRKLKDLTDQSPGELIRMIRMQRAHDLLQQHAATVAEVCYKVGYTNPANFSTAFSKHFGYPPSAVPEQGAIS